MPKIAGNTTTVVEIDGLLTIQELVGNASTKDDEMSIALVRYDKPATDEPWMVNDYDEWLNVKSGKIVVAFKNEDGIETSLEANAGETLFVGKGERVRFSFPVGGTEYNPICYPAFRPDRSHREENNEEIESPVKLREVKDDDDLQCREESEADEIYHMCKTTDWEAAVASRKAYFPPTFEADGFFTHATAVAERLIETANHFYTSSKGEWMCLQLSRSALKDAGIITKFEEPAAVGKTESNAESSLICPHIYGGIPTIESLGVLTKTYQMLRNDDGEFLAITGLTDN